MKSTPRKHGLTLVELLVVLTILVVLTGIAAQSVSGIADQSRFEATQRTLNNVRQAVVGSDRNNLADPLACFVADMGRFPSSLQELVDNTNNAPRFELRTLVVGSQVTKKALVPCGWRGPYMRLPVGSNELNMNYLRDGWGNPLVPAITVVPPIQPPSSLLSMTITSPPRSGTNNEVYNNALTVTIGPHDWQATTISGKLYQGNNTSGVWRVTLFTPNPEPDLNDESTFVLPISVTSSESPNGMVSTTPNVDVSFTLKNNLSDPQRVLSIGPRVLCAFRDDELIGNPVYLTLRPGATHNDVNFHH